MTGESIIEFVGGFIAFYVGVRWVIARRIPVVSEGGFEPLGWIKGTEAVVVGLCVVVGGLLFLAASVGLVRLG